MKAYELLSYLKSGLTITGNDRGDGYMWIGKKENWQKQEKIKDNYRKNIEKKKRKRSVFKKTLIAFLFLLSPLAGNAQTVGVIYTNTGGFEYGIDANSNEVIQNIACTELYSGVSGELPEISSIEIPMRYADDQMPPLKPTINIAVKIYNNYDSTEDLMYQTVHNLNTGDNGYVTITIPEANRFICSNGFAYSVEIQNIGVFFTNVDFGGVSTGTLTINGEVSPFFDAKFIVNGIFPPPPPPPPEEMNTAMQYGLNLILISFFLWFMYSFSKGLFRGFVYIGKDVKKEFKKTKDLKKKREKGLL